MKLQDNSRRFAYCIGKDIDHTLKVSIQMCIECKESDEKFCNMSQIANNISRNVFSILNQKMMFTLEENWDFFKERTIDALLKGNISLKDMAHFQIQKKKMHYYFSYRDFEYMNCIVINFCFVITFSTSIEKKRKKK